MRRAARLDANHGAIRDGLRKLGMFVWDCSSAGNGGPDLMVWRGGWFALEIKDGTKSPSRRALTPAEAAFHAALEAKGGRVWVVHDLGQALEVTRRDV